MKRSAHTISLLGCIAVLAGGAGQAAAATYPSAAGSKFDRDAEGWTSTRATCTAAAGGGGVLCTQTNAWEGTAGNPAGSIVARTKVLVNGGELFRGDSTWRSPSFTTPKVAGSAILQYDRRIDLGSTVALSPKAVVETVLVDQATAQAYSLGSETLTEADTAFAARRVTVAPGTLTAGHSYRIELRSTTSTTTAREGVLGDTVLRYDNVSLVVNDQPGAGGSPGVTYPGSPISSKAFHELSSKLSINAEFGRGPGGSLVAMSKCTILGTPGNDRITGSTGNDVICGLGGNDIVNGGRGKDIVDGANGNDRLSGSGSGDMLLGLRGKDRLDGGAGSDRIGAGAGSDRAGGRAGNDRLVGASGNDRLNGDSGRDTIRGKAGRDRVVGGAGGDRLYGDAGRDTLAGQAGNDRLTGGRNADRLSAGAGRDRISARDRGRDRVNGGKGRDRASVDGRRSRASRRDRVRAVESTS